MKRLTTFNQFISSQISFKTLSILFVFFLFLTITKVHAQIPDTLFTSADTSFFDIKNKLDAFFNSPGYLGSRSLTLNEDDIESNYGRWEINWQSRLDATGNMNVANRAMYEYKYNGTGCNRTNDITYSNNYQWKSIGPNSTDYATNSNTQNQGRIISISANPSNINSILCSGVGGGIWKSDNGGVTWHNVTDDEGFSTFGYSSIKRSPVDPNWIFASSVNGNQGPYALLYESNLPYSGGIIMSIDNGETWTEIQSVNEIPNSPLIELPGILSLELGGISTLNTQNYFLRKAHGLVEVLVDKSFGTPAITVINREVTGANDPWVPLKYHDLAVGMIGTKEVVVLSRGAELFIAEKEPLITGTLTFIKITNFQSKIRDIPINDATFFDRIDILKKIEVDISQENIIIDVCYGAGINVHRVILYSNDKGISWSTNQSTFHTSANTNDYGFEVSKTNNQIIYTNRDGSIDVTCCDRRGIVKSIDGGLTFSSMPRIPTSPFMHTDVRCLSICKSDPIGGSSDIVFYGNDGGLVRTLDGLNWEVINGTGLVLGHHYGIGINEKNEKEILGGAQDGSEGYFLNGKWTGNYRNDRSGSGDNGESVVDIYNTSVKYISQNYNLARCPTPTLGVGIHTHSLGEKTILFPMELNKGNPLNLIAGYRVIYEIINAQTSLIGSPIEPDLDEYANIITLSTTKDPNRIYFARNIFFNHGFDGVMGNSTNPIFRADKVGSTWTITPINNSENMGRNPIITIPPDAPTLIGGQPGKEDPLYSAMITDMVANPNDNTGNRLWVTFGGFAEGKHVYFTSDAGASWSVVQQNCLPNFPINCIAYQEGTNDRIYVGTDVGVFFTDNTMNHWEKYGINYPDIPVLDIEFNYCGNKMVISTYGRGIWEAPLLPANDWVISSDLDLANVHYDVHSNIHITKDPITSALTTLKITNGSIINMAANTKIIIDQGCKLLVDNSTITNECNTMWEGIVVRGDKMNPQELTSNDNTTNLSPTEGYVYLYNATISYAREAIRLWNPEQEWVSANQIDNQGESGGIVIAENSTFINNRRSVEFMWYKNYDWITGIETPNMSSFKECTFKVTDEYRTDYPFYAHVSMWDNRGINYKACTFANNKTNSSIYENKGIGIISMDANYTIENIGSILSQFKNLTMGINVINSQKGATNINVIKTAFLKNQIGSYLLNSNQSVFRGNSIWLGRISNEISEPDINIIGVGFNQSGQFTCEDNTFNGYTTGTSAYTIGSWFINNSLTSNPENVSSGNKFSKIPWASYANYYNRKDVARVNFGLQFNCNKNENNIHDFYSWSGTSILSDAGIRDNQGNMTKYAGNTFSIGSTATFAQFNHNEANYINYYTSASSASDAPDPTKVDGNTSIVFNGVTTPVCPIKVFTPPSIPIEPQGDILYTGMGWIQTDDKNKLSPTDRTNAEIAFINHKNAYLSYSNQLKALIDAGNTDVLLTQINSSTTTTSITSLRTDLLGASPYLSQTVLEATVNNTALPPAVLFEVLGANPDAGTNENIINKLIDLNMPQYMIDYIQNNIGTINAKKLLESAISEEHEEMMKFHRIIIQDILNDPIAINHTEYRGWLGQLNTIEADYEIVDDYIATGQYINATDFMNDILNNYSLKQTELNDYNDLLSFNNWKIEALNSTGSLQHLDNSQLEELQSIANNGGRISKYRAQSILNYFYDGTYQTEPEFPTQNNQRRINPYIRASKPIDNAYILVYPNPSKEIIHFEYNIPCTETEAILEIRDISGKLILLKSISKEIHLYTLVTDTYSSGTYLYKMLCSGSVIGKGKFSVLK